VNYSLKNIYYYILLRFYNMYRMKACGSKNLLLNPLLINYKFLSIGSKVFVRDGARIEGVSRYLGRSYNPNIVINDNVSIEQNFHLTCAGNITIGTNTAIAANVTITDINHPYTDINLPPEKQHIEVTDVSIGDDCKIFNNVVILPGANLGKHCIIGANSVVRGNNYPEYCVIVGLPATVIKRYSFQTNSWLKTKPNGEFID
jgi:acetyltransferase-like isoleucine patch superfamily enzyme